MKEIEVKNNLYVHIEYLKHNWKPSPDYAVLESIEVAIKAIEKQIEMKKYCNEHSCIDCPYSNPLGDSNRCMNDFIMDRSDEE